MTRGCHSCPGRGRALRAPRPGGASVAKPAQDGLISLENPRLKGTCCAPAVSEQPCRVPFAPSRGTRLRLGAALQGRREPPDLRDLLRNGTRGPQWGSRGLGALEKGARLDRTVAVSACQSRSVPAQRRQHTGSEVRACTSACWAREGSGSQGSGEVRPRVAFPQHGFVSDDRSHRSCGSIQYCAGRPHSSLLSCP